MPKISSENRRGCCACIMQTPRGHKLCDAIIVTPSTYNKTHMPLHLATSADLCQRHMCLPACLHTCLSAVRLYAACLPARASVPGCLPACLSARLCLAACLPARVSVPACLPSRLPVRASLPGYLPACPRVCAWLPAHASVPACLPARASVPACPSLHARISACAGCSPLARTSACLPACLPTCLPACPSVHAAPGAHRLPASHVAPSALCGTLPEPLTSSWLRVVLRRKLHLQWFAVWSVRFAVSGCGKCCNARCACNGLRFGICGLPYVVARSAAKQGAPFVVAGSAATQAAPAVACSLGFASTRMPPGLSHTSKMMSCTLAVAAQVDSPHTYTAGPAPSQT
eukprot:364524-Chlamydomonas_euryale.AAC.3